jgi:hypothetical protein
MCFYRLLGEMINIGERYLRVLRNRKAGTTCESLGVHNEDRGLDASTENSDMKLEMSTAIQFYGDDGYGIDRISTLREHTPESMDLVFDC